MLMKSLSEIQSESSFDKIKTRVNGPEDILIGYQRALNRK